MHQVHIVGLGIDHNEIAPAILRRIENAEVLVGGDRLLNIFRDYPGIKVPIKSPLERVIERVKKEMQLHRDVVVLADGDPLFFGIGERLINVLGREKVMLYPGITTLQVAASGMKIPWHDMETVSLHGRQDVLPLLTALVESHRVAVFTDLNFHPARLADELLRRGIDVFNMHVFEDLGMKSERAACFALKDAAKTTFSTLNFVILERTKTTEVPLFLGLDDDLYKHPKGLITKKEIRAVGLSALAIKPNHVVWDLGAGCGSMAIEASLLAHKGTVLAVEKNADRVQLIRDNIRRMGAYGVQVIYGEMPECLESLPDPDRIFIGGGIGKSNKVLEIATGRLRPGGKLVLHLVLMGSLARTRDYLKGLNWPFAITQIEVSRSRSIAGDQRLEALNPVFIVDVKKKL
ncbi:MAG: precorrin-6y C5,15-methyltransferase (decarboxylating) subunit CbiE [Deltaproteobacteria bacterium]|nr:precorrin-6y C5,15-methyltransferase (decarboxylating) subunit CbiE [Deltaproteobacteria bacterium]